VNGQPELAADGTGWTLVLERALPHARQLVWAALTEVGQLAHWAPFVADRDLTSAGPVGLIDRDVAEPHTAEGQVRTAEAPSLLVVDWGPDTLRWELADDSGGTRLTLRHRFADREQAPSYAAGWHLCFEALGALLAGTPMESVVGDSAMSHGWAELNARYTEQLLGSRSR
jgi:uncharacterized protein YndB with AHSA1/START domain